MEVSLHEIRSLSETSLLLFPERESSSQHSAPNFKKTPRVSLVTGLAAAAATVAGNETNFLKQQQHTQRLQKYTPPPPFPGVHNNQKKSVRKASTFLKTTDLIIKKSSATALKLPQNHLCLWTKIHNKHTS
jgi:hypothetical protein